MTDLRYSTGTEPFEFLYAKCREDHDLLAMIHLCAENALFVDEYIVSLSDSKLIELEDLENFLANNFGDN